MKLKQTFLLTIILSCCFMFSSFAMINRDIRTTPLNDNEDYSWTWIDDEVCVRFKADQNMIREYLVKQSEAGLLARWAEKSSDRGWFPKIRDTYLGKWNQSEDGIWSFRFDDYTIPIGITKIDGVLYAFNGFGELQDGLVYYETDKGTPLDKRKGLQTGADGIVNSDDPAFLAWLETQYVPDCTSHE